MGLRLHSVVLGKKRRRTKRGKLKKQVWGTKKARGITTAEVILIAQKRFQWGVGSVNRRARRGARQ